MEQKEMIIDGQKYVTKPSKERKRCTGCVALHEIKRCVEEGGNANETLCLKLGNECSSGEIVWVKGK